MDTELIKYIIAAANAWQTWSKSKRTPADMLAFAAIVSAVPARAQILWTSKDYGQAFAAMRLIALNRWQVILADPKLVTAKQFSDAIIDTAIVERSRIRIEVDGVPGDYSDVWLTLAKLSGPGLIVGLISGQFTVEQMVDDAKQTAQTIAKAAPAIGTGVVIGLVALAAIVILK